MIAEAVRTRACDIHIEPMKDRVRVRYRIDGECVERDRIPLRMKGPLISRIEDHGRHRHRRKAPAAGRAHQADGRQVATSTSASARCPPITANRSCCVFCAPTRVRIGIQNLGFEEEDYKVFQKIIKRPNGIFLVTGPTGSGKTTTLYGALNELNRPDRKIITAEDPVEYNFVGINQCQVRDSIGLTLRQDSARHAAPGAQHHSGRRNPRSWKWPKSPSRPPSPATWSSARCTPTTPPARSPA